MKDDLNSVKDALVFLTNDPTNRGAILVRPDEHVAWCSRSHVSGDHYIEMEKVFSTVLGCKL